MGITLGYEDLNATTSCGTTLFWRWSPASSMDIGSCAPLAGEEHPEPA